MNESVIGKMFNQSGPVLVVASGILTLMIGSQYVQTTFQSDFVVLTGVILIVLGGGISAFSYLRGDKIRSNSGIVDNYLNITNTLEDEDIERIANAIKVHIGAFRGDSQFDFTEEERKEVIQSIQLDISKKLAEDLFKSVKSAVVDNVTENKYFLELRRELQKTKARLTDEIGALTRRGNLNLVIGGVTTILAVALLGYVVLTAQSEALELKDFVWHYVPRITISIFIQIFSFFFLRLYRNSLDDIKYFQNELTNVDSRYAAFEAALLLGDKSIVSKVIQEILNTDRNSKLKKGESTVALEKLKEENKSLTEMLGSAKDLISSIKK